MSAKKFAIAIAIACALTFLARDFAASLDCALIGWSPLGGCR